MIMKKPSAKHPSRDWTLQNDPPKSKPKIVATPLTTLMDRSMDALEALEKLVAHAELHEQFAEHVPTFEWMRHHMNEQTQRITKKWLTEKGDNK